MKTYTWIYRNTSYLW